ncbi:MAG: gluconokinase [Acidobacteriota bacterium]
MIIVLMGVSGSGKTAVGIQLARDLDWKFFDGDDFHSPANVERMAHGIALTDEDRLPWLEELARLISEIFSQGKSAVVACSALRRSYREILRGGSDAVRFVYLKGSPELIRHRLRGRAGHFFDPRLLASQFDTLEEPPEAMIIDVSPPVAVIVAQIRVALGL